MYIWTYDNLRCLSHRRCCLLPTQAEYQFRYPLNGDGRIVYPELAPIFNRIDLNVRIWPTERGDKELAPCFNKKDDTRWRACNATVAASWNTSSDSSMICGVRYIQSRLYHIPSSWSRPRWFSSSRHRRDPRRDLRLWFSLAWRRRLWPGLLLMRESAEHSRALGEQNAASWNVEVKRSRSQQPTQRENHRCCSSERCTEAKRQRWPKMLQPRFHQADERSVSNRTQASLSRH